MKITFKKFIVCSLLNLESEKTPKSDLEEDMTINSQRENQNRIGCSKLGQSLSEELAEDISKG